MKCVILAIMTLSLLLGGCYDNHGCSAEDPLVSGETTSISRIYEIASETVCHTITSDMVCVGRVTTSDREGNFYRTMFVEDATGGVEVQVGIYDVASQYPEGLEVALHLKDCAVMKHDGVVQVGLPPQSYDDFPREFESQVMLDRYVVRGTSVAPIAPRLVDVPSLSAEMCGRRVRVENLRYVADDISPEEPRLVGYCRFEDSDGCVLFCYISEYADFANIVAPTTAVALQGILLYEDVGGGNGHHFVLKPSYRDDIEVTTAIH